MSVQDFLLGFVFGALATMCYFSYILTRWDKKKKNIEEEEEEEDSADWWKRGPRD